MTINKKISLKGFTLIEICVTVGIFVVLFYLASLSFNQLQKGSILKDNLWQIVTVLRQSQSQAGSAAVVQDSHLRYGVLFGSNYYQEFATLTDFSNREQSLDLKTDLPSSLEFINFNMPDNCLQLKDCLIFSTLNGLPAASGSVILRNNAGPEQKKIIVNKEGRISY